MLEPRPDYAPERKKAKPLDRVIASAVSSVVVVEALWLGAKAGLGAANYSWGFFILAPIVAGILSTLILGWKEPRKLGDAFATAAITGLIGMLASLVILGEGVVCACMALPFALLLLLLGSYAGHRLLELKWGKENPPRLMASVLIVFPLAMVTGGTTNELSGLRQVQTRKIVSAAPDEIWPLLYNMKRLPEPEFWMFQAGVAHPVEIRTDGDRRYCVLSTGEMPERITISERNRVLEFEVLDTPPTMKELNPFFESRPAHLTGYFECVRGRFELRPLGNGRTEIVGTSWYRHRFAPAWYWNLWCDAIVHNVHREVISEIERRVAG